MAVFIVVLLVALFLLRPKGKMAWSPSPITSTSSWCSWPTWCVGQGHFPWRIRLEWLNF
jgi:hypothetical protein